MALFHRPGCRIGGRLSAVLVLIAGATATATHASWTVTNLHPPGVIQTSKIFAGDGSQQGGIFHGFGRPDHAILWNGSAASGVDLDPVGQAFSSSRISAMNGGHQVGSALPTSSSEFSHAALWTGTRASFVDLGPLVVGVRDSFANGVFGNQQVGGAIMNIQGNRHASLWTGTAASWVDLNPSGSNSSEALGTDGIHQVGSAVVTVGNEVVQCASMWNGTASSWINLAVAGSHGSSAVAISGSEQVGNTFGNSHACLWRGTAASMVDLNPTGALTSSASAVFNGIEVGFASFDQNGHARASLWRGSAGSWEDLSLSLGGVWAYSYATSVWSNNGTLYVGGFGYNSTTGREEALLWSQPIPTPSAVTVVTLAGILPCLRRRR